MNYFLNDEITEDTVHDLIAVINEAEEKEDSLSVYVSSNGGDAYLMTILIHLLCYCKVQVDMFAIQAFSAGCGLFKGCKSDNIKRYAFPHSVFMDHPGIIHGTLSKNGVHYHETYDKSTEYLKKNTIKPFQDTDPDYFFGPEEALSLGLIDEIIELF